MASEKKVTIVIGASSGIGQALIQQLSATPQHQVIAITRQLGDQPARSSNISWIECDNSAAEIEAVCSQLKELNRRIDRIVICQGLLHDDEVFPEKQLRELEAEKWQKVMQVNVLLPMMWVQGLMGVLPTQQTCVLALFSARVGSISDNRLGGWYSYRTSKAALNMMLKTASLELRRTHPNVSCLLFHPGTTDTQLSKPFSSNVSPKKLFSVDFVADKLVSLMDAAEPGRPAVFIDWAGKEIAW